LGDYALRRMAPRPAIPKYQCVMAKGDKRHVLGPGPGRPKGVTKAVMLKRRFQANLADLEDWKRKKGVTPAEVMQTAMEMHFRLGVELANQVKNMPKEKKRERDAAAREALSMIRSAADIAGKIREYQEPRIAPVKPSNGRAPLPKLEDMTEDELDRLASGETGPDGEDETRYGPATPDAVHNLHVSEIPRGEPPSSDMRPT
jgi:hypothetical protein